MESLFYFYLVSNNIKSWSIEDRPREKLELKGREFVTDAELIAILIGTGLKNKSAVDLAKELLLFCNNDLYKLSKLSIKEISKSCKGIGKVKAITITAALELGIRLKAFEKQKAPKITSSKQAYELFNHNFFGLSQEEFWVAYLNQANKLIELKKIGEGGINSTIADPRIIFKHALLLEATTMILMHNHPSGNLQASTADIELTKKIKNGSSQFDIKILDHLIFTDSSYLSLADEGLL